MNRARDSKPVEVAPQKPTSLKHTEIPMPKVKEPKQNITIGVNVDGLDEAMKKLNEMMEVCKKIDTLQQRIIKGADHIEKIANRLPR